MKKHFLFWALLPLIVTAQSTQRIEADNILLQTRTPQISNTNVTVAGSMKITAVANGSSTDSVLVVANGTLKRIARSAFSDYVSKTVRDTITAPKNFTRYVLIDSLYGKTFNLIHTGSMFDQLGFRPPSSGIVSPYLKASASDNGTQRVRTFRLPSSINDDTLLVMGDSNWYATKSDINGLATTSSVNAALALKQNTLTLTTTGSGPATLNSSTGALNIPVSSGGTPAGSTGQVQFNNAGSFGASANLHWDNVNNRLGINRVPLGYALEVNGSIGIKGDQTIYSYNNPAHPNIYFGTTGLLQAGWCAPTAFGVGQGTTSATLARLAVTGATLTGTSASGIMLGGQTWNTSGNPKALLINVTNSQSGQDSKLLELQIGGTSQFDVDKNGKLSIATGTNKSVGTATLSAGTVTVNTTAVTANSGIQLTVQESGTNNGRLRISAKVAGTSFTITSSDSGDNCTVFYQIIN